MRVGLRCMLTAGFSDTTDLMIDKTTPEFAAALTRASEELGLPDYYRSCVRPLLSMPTTQWPMCCGSRCDPCAQTLVAVAVRVCELLAVNPEELGRS